MSNLGLNYIINTSSVVCFLTRPNAPNGLCGFRFPLEKKWFHMVGDVFHIVNGCKTRIFGNINKLNTREYTQSRRLSCVIVADVTLMHERLMGEISDGIHRMRMVCIRTLLSIAGGRMTTGSNREWLEHHSCLSNGLV